MKLILYRLWRIPLRHAIWLLLPLQVLVAWVYYQGWQGKRIYDDFQAVGWGVTPPADQVQEMYFLRDQLRRSIGKMLAPPVPSGDAVETFGLTIDREDLVALNSRLPASGKLHYYNGLLDTKDGRDAVEARYMGDNHWHWLYPHKSWRVKTTRGEPFRDTRAFNLKNSPTKLVIEEAFISQISREQGLLAPEIEPVKLMLNNAYSGMSLFWPVADESLLRRARRMPGSIYSGDGAPADQTGVSQLWYKSSYWDKVASRNAEQERYRGDIEALVEVISEDDPERFHAFAERYLDLEQFTKYVATDRLLGSRHHDYYHNHKLYFDPYKGRWEPIMWDYGEWTLTGRPATFDQVTFPLLNAVRRHPANELAIQRQHYQLLTEVLPVEEFERRWDQWYDRIAPALKADGGRDYRDWNASSMLKLQKVHNAWFSMGQYRAWIAAAKDEYGKRSEWVLRRMERSNLAYKLDELSPGTYSMHMLVSGLVGQVWNQLRVPSAEGEIILRRDRNMNGKLDESDPVVARAEVIDAVAHLEFAEELLPGLRIEDRPGGPSAPFGNIQFRPIQMRYRYFLSAAAGLQGELELSSENAVTGSPVPVAIVKRVRPRAGNYPYSLHPWKLPPPPPAEEVSIGPGQIRIDEDRVYGATTTVRIKAGTTLQLGPKVSLFFEGPVFAEGSADAPIIVEPAVADQPWGVFDLHGQGTRGSRLAHARFSGGSVAERNLVRRSGMVTVMDSSDIRMENCFFGTNHVGDDSLHWGYVKDGVVVGSRFEDARSDAFDIDISEQILVQDCQFFGSINDGLDIMTSVVAVTDCSFEKAGDKGISVGEASNLRLSTSTFTRCVIGVEIKDNSEAHIDDGSAFFSCPVAVNLYRKNERYSKGGRLYAGVLHTTDCEEDWKADKRSQVFITGPVSRQPGQ